MGFLITFLNLLRTLAVFFFFHGEDPHLHQRAGSYGDLRARHHIWYEGCRSFQEIITFRVRTGGRNRPCQERIRRSKNVAELRRRTRSIAFNPWTSIHSMGSSAGHNITWPKHIKSVSSHHFTRWSISVSTKYTQN